jgi:transcriptional regulator with XRE-family HTH domain
VEDRSRGAFGDFLRSRRLRLAPEVAGLPNRRRRRTAGLRREEVAELAGIGVDWYIRLEQGRAVRPSAATIDALARALRLSRIEHGHLRRLAEANTNRRHLPEVVPETVRRLVESLNQPAYVTGRRWDVLAWNKAAAEIFGFDRLQREDRNLLISVLTRPEARRLFGRDWSSQAKRMVAHFRTTHDLWADDPAFLQLLERLRRDSAEFSVWWSAHDVESAPTGRKSLVHPKKGNVSLEYSTFQSNENPALRLTIYAPV